MALRQCSTIARGGYNLESFQANQDRLVRLILLIALAMTSAWLQGQKTKLNRQQNYVCCVQEQNRTKRRHSNFWLGLYGFNWTVAWNECHAWVEELITSVRFLAELLSKRIKGYETYTARTLAPLSPPEVSLRSQLVKVCKLEYC